MRDPRGGAAMRSGLERTIAVKLMPSFRQTSIIARPRPPAAPTTATCRGRRSVWPSMGTVVMVWFSYPVAPDLGKQRRIDKVYGALAGSPASRRNWQFDILRTKCTRDDCWKRWEIQRNCPWRAAFVQIWISRGQLTRDPHNAPSSPLLALKVVSLCCRNPQSEPDLGDTRRPIVCG